MPIFTAIWILVNILAASIAVYFQSKVINTLSACVNAISLIYVVSGLLQNGSIFYLAIAIALILVLGIQIGALLEISSFAKKRSSIGGLQLSASKDQAEAEFRSAVELGDWKKAAIVYNAKLANSADGTRMRVLYYQEVGLDAELDFDSWTAITIQRQYQ